jgi:hypothetical protein
MFPVGTSKQRTYTQHIDSTGVHNATQLTVTVAYTYSVHQCMYGLACHSQHSTCATGMRSLNHNTVEQAAAAGCGLPPKPAPHGMYATACMEGKGNTRTPSGTKRDATS